MLSIELIEEEPPEKARMNSFEWFGKRLLFVERLLL
jgi:hypothetical protein